MLLTEFIYKSHHTIIEDWVEFAKTLLPWAKGMDDVSLRDHAEELLTAVVEDMNSPQTVSEQSEKSKGKAIDGALAKIGQKHASDRLETGITLDQLVSEFRALRASVLRHWEETQTDLNGEVTRFNEAIDETLTESTARYSEIVNSTREQFLGILGHDLRNPIGAILMGAGLLLESKDLESAEIARSIVNSAERMSRMVNDLLDLTRTRLGSGIPVCIRPTDLVTICEQIVAELQAMHPKVRLQFKSKGRLDGNWDSDRLAQALSNLIGNAIQYGDIDKPITIVAEDKVDGITIVVHNEGVKIPESAMKTIFAPMARHMPGGQKIDKNLTGLGLGLYIAKEIVVAHGGTVEVTSSDRDGTSFLISLPRRSLPNP